MSHKTSRRLFVLLALAVLLLALIYASTSVLAQEPAPTPTPQPTLFPQVESLKPLNASSFSAPSPVDPDCSDGECVFMVSAPEDDAGPEWISCAYQVNWNEIYFGECSNETPTSIVSGFRFDGVNIGRDAAIAEAYLEFTVDGPYSDPVTVAFFGEASADAASFGDDSESSPETRENITASVWRFEGKKNFSQKIDEVISVTWEIADTWTLGEVRQSPDLTPIIRAIVKQPDWNPGQALAIIVKNVEAHGTRRRVIAYDRPVWFPGNQYAARLVIKLATPPPPSTSLYLTKHIMDKKTFDAQRLNELGCAEAKRGDVLTILDFGPPQRVPQQGEFVYGTLLVDSNVFVSTTEIASAAESYITGFWNCSQVDDRLTLAIGTNNTLIAGKPGTKDQAAEHGRAWAEMVNDVDRWLSSQPCESRVCDFHFRVGVAGAIDIEDWYLDDIRKFADPYTARAWANAYVNASDLGYYNFGDCSQCNWSGPEPYDEDPKDNVPPNYWNRDDYWYLSWGIRDDKGRTGGASPIPEIYFTEPDADPPMAEQWQKLAVYALTCQSPCPPAEGRRDDIDISFLGALTQCEDVKHKDKPCVKDTNKPEEGWLQLFNQLSDDVITSHMAHSLHWSTDIVHDYKLKKK